jgi:type IV secretory pathway VirB2 component (pilin)
MARRTRTSFIITRSGYRTAMSMTGAQHGADDQVADTVSEVTREHDWVEPVVRAGWAAKGVVYSLMGLLALSIARQQPAEEDASPEGALSVVLEQPFGRVLLAVLAVGLVLYSCWRVLTVALIRGSDVKDWLERIGYSFSAAFYAVLAVTAGRHALAGRDPERSSTVESLSSSVLGSTFGRVVVGAAGVIVIGVSLYFASKAVRRSFLENLTFEGASEGERHLVTTSGVVGWAGRAVVTFLVGLFVTIAAVQADPSQARGFDQSLRTVASSSWGTSVVLLAAVGLIVYGVYCLLSLRHRELEN